MLKKTFIKLICAFIPQKRARKEMRQYLTNFSFSRLPPSSKNPKLIMTILAKDEADIIEENLKFHKAMGVDGFIVTDNLSTDGTLKIFQKYQKKGWILELIEEASQDHNQIDWVSRMVRIAKDKYQAEWVINCDADEFWFSKKHNLKFEISGAKFNILKCPIFNIIPSKNTPLLKSSQKIIKPLKDVEKYGLKNFNFFSKQIPKVMHKTDGFMQTHMGNHDVDLKRRVYKNSSDISIYHFSIRNQEHFKRKMLMGGAAVERNKKLGEKAGEHWYYFYKGYQNGTLDLNEEYHTFMAYKHHGTLKKEGHIIEDKDLYFFFNQFIDLEERFKEVEKSFPKVASTKETLEKIIQNKASITRFGDAEFTVITGENPNDPYQRPDPKLAKRLGNILKEPSSETLLIAIPELDSQYNNLQNFKNSGVSFWKYYWTPRFKKLSKYITQPFYYNAFLSRENLFYENTLDEIKKIWSGRDVLFVASREGRFKMDIRLFDTINKSYYFSDFKSTHSYDDYDKIMKNILKYPKDTLILIVAGPTASVLVYDLHRSGYQALDIGHLPNSYTQYLGESDSPESLPLKQKKKVLYK